jgi:hypothetical protein
MRFLVLAGALGVGLCLADVSLAANTVVVESKTVTVGENGTTIGVYVENAGALEALVIALEIRTVTGGAYMSDNTLQFREAGRVVGSDLLFFPNLIFSSTPAEQTCSGPVSQTWSGSVGKESNDGSPDAVFWYGNTEGGYGSFPPGSDPPGSPSFVITFDVNGYPGTFEIDTCCRVPATHLWFVDDVTYDPIYPEFTKGMITIEPCPCDCLADPQCNGLTDALDVVQAVNVSFRGQSSVLDPNANCTFESTDVNCDGGTDVIDVIRLINVAFRSADPAVQFCDLCGAT